MKIAVTGNTISHEMGHGFDTEGRTRDENGDVKDWWAKEDLVEYDKRVNCLVEQYNNYDDPDFGKNVSFLLFFGGFLLFNEYYSVRWQSYTG